ncbi:MAG: fasciclin domain-containing protein [Cyanobacteria bacterium J06648_1]
MNLKHLSQFTRNFIVLASVLGIGSFSVLPAIADDHTGSAKPASEIEEMPTNKANTEAGNIVEVASGSETFSTLVTAVGAAELAETLSDPSASYTVFAPTDEAFSELPDGALEYLLMPENQEVLQQVLTYHVLPTKVMSSDISDGEVESLNGGLITEVTDSGVIINNASVISTDIKASNGIIHAVNRVLLPADLQTALASELGITEEEIYQ